MTLIPTPGQGRVMLEPGVNLAAWIDSKFLPGTMWQGTWDPEGILSTFPSVATGITGMMAGHLLISDRSSTNKVIYFLVAGLFLAALGYVWGLAFPVNENLWTSSFVLVTSGMASMVFGAAYYTIDVRGFSQGTQPGIIFGANAITAYVLADVLALIFYRMTLGDATLSIHAVDGLAGLGMSRQLGSALYALFFVTVNFIPVIILYRKKIFIKL